MAARGGGRPAVFAIVGKESSFDSFLAEETLERVLAETVGDNRQEAVETLRGDEVSWARVADAARSPSLFVPVKAVVVRAADALKGGEEEILRFLEAPPAGTALILVAAKPDRRRKAWQRILASAEVLPAEALKGRALVAYARDQARQRKLALPAEALDELVEHVGQDLRRLTGELDKLAAFARGGGRPLTPDDVAAVVGRGLGRPVYRLSDAISARESARALELIDELLEEGEQGPYLVGVLYRAVRQIRGIRALLAQRVRHDEIAARLRIMPFKIRDLAAAAAKWSDAEVRWALSALSQADRLLKRGADAATTLDAAIVSICRRAAPGHHSSIQ
jgi:DNA polymerase-3 subunit delta